jgi:hypothetical protein
MRSSGVQSAISAQTREKPLPGFSDLLRLPKGIAATLLLGICFVLPEMDTVEVLQRLWQRAQYHYGCVHQIAASIAPLR